MGLDDRATDGDAPTATAGVTPADGRDAAVDVPTETLTTLDRAATEAGLIYGLLALIRGLVTPEALIRSLGVWARSPGRPLREILIERGHLEEAEARRVDDLALTHVEQHGGSPHEALVALGEEASARLDPDEVADPEIRGLLAALVDGPTPRRPDATTGFGARYEVIRQHARGGLGVVSLARDREIHREVALKEIRDDRAHDPDYRARFLREAEVTGRLEHPGIVPVYGIGHRADGRPYYIMRFIRGETLKIAIGRLHKPGGGDDEVEPAGRHDLHSLVGRFIDACHAMAYAHSRKILHRDIKPTNIMLGPFGETLVVDWGLAKSFDGSGGGEAPSGVEEEAIRPESGSGMTPTRVGSEVGTLGYMSPEQAEGRLTELGPPSDIYSLGVTLYILAAGRGPFEGLGRAEFLRKVRAGDFPGPSRVNPAISPALEAICLKAMALRPADRYQTATELGDDLERWRAGQPVLAYPEPILDRLARWTRRHQTALAGAAVLLACSTIGLAILAAREGEANRLIQAERDSAEAGRRSALARLESSLEIVADLTSPAQSQEIRAKMAGELVASYREILAKSPDDPAIRFNLARACKLSAHMGLLTGQLDGPSALYAEAIGLLEATGARLPEGVDPGVELAVLRDEAGEYLRSVGKPAEAEAEHRKGLETLGRAVDPGRPPAGRRRVEAILQLDLAGDLFELGRVGPSMQACRRAIELLGPPARLTGNRTERLLLVLASIIDADTSRVGGDFARAKDVLAEAERLARESVASSFDPDSRFALAGVRVAQGYLLLDAEPETPRGPALAAFQEAVERLYGLYLSLPRMIAYRRSLAAALVGRGTCFLDLERVKDARSDLIAARQLMEELAHAIPGHAGDLAQLGAALTGLGRVARAEGDPDAARAQLKRAVDRISAARAINPDAPDDRKLLARARRELADLDGATAPAPSPP